MRNQSGALLACSLLVLGLVGCSSDAQRTASGPDESGAVDAVQVVTCPDQQESGAGFAPRKIPLINETSMTIKLQVDSTSWSCANYSGTMNPSQLNGLVIPPNLGKDPVMITVSTDTSHAALPLGVLANIGSSDMPWISIGHGYIIVSQIYGYTPCPDAMSHSGACELPLVDKAGVNHGKFFLSSFDHTGQEDDKYWSALRFFPV